MAPKNLTSVGLEEAEIRYPSNVVWNASTSELYEHIIRRDEGTLSQFGTVVTSTGERTGRSANDKFIVRESSCEDKVWWGSVNVDISEAKFNQLYEKVKAYTQHRELFVQDCWAGADERYKLPVRIITEEARHSLFARNMLGGTPDRNRTCGPQIRNLMLYPTELRGHLNLQAWPLDPVQIRYIFPYGGVRTT